jgi:hypothetical protein
MPSETENRALVLRQLPDDELQAIRLVRWEKLSFWLRKGIEATDATLQTVTEHYRALIMVDAEITRRTANDH